MGSTDFTFHHDLSPSLKAVIAGGKAPGAGINSLAMSIQQAVAPAIAQAFGHLNLPTGSPIGMHTGALSRAANLTPMRVKMGMGRPDGVSRAEAARASSLAFQGAQWGAALGPAPTSIGDKIGAVAGDVAALIKHPVVMAAAAAVIAVGRSSVDTMEARADLGNLSQRFSRVGSQAAMIVGGNASRFRQLQGSESGKGQMEQILGAAESARMNNMPAVPQDVIEKAAFVARKTGRADIVSSQIASGQYGMIGLQYARFKDAPDAAGTFAGRLEAAATARMAGGAKTGVALDIEEHGMAAKAAYDIYRKQRSARGSAGDLLEGGLDVIIGGAISLQRSRAMIPGLLLDARADIPAQVGDYHPSPPGHLSAPGYNPRTGGDRGSMSNHLMTASKALAEAAKQAGGTPGGGQIPVNAGSR